MDDNLLRGAASAAGVTFYSLLFKYLKTHLDRSRDKHGCGAPERLGRALGRLWARSHRGYKRALRR